MKWTLALETLLLWTSTTTVMATPQPPKAMPSTGQAWQTTRTGVEFQPAANLSPLAKRHLRALTSDNDNDNDNDSEETMIDKGILASSSSPMGEYVVDGMETYYDQGAQAWRALGWYIDCDYTEQMHMRMASASANENNNNNAYNNMQGSSSNSGCQRFLLWAAYVDESYAGGGRSEYKYYDRHTASYSNMFCQKGQRCAKMDCHESNTHYSLLGFFKEPYYDAWLQTVFQNQGDCVWSDEEYAYMLQKSSLAAWPKQCTASIFTDRGSSIYYDVAPAKYGDLGIGLYQDATCTRPYNGKLTPTQLLKGMVCGGHLGDGVVSDDEISRICREPSSNTVQSVYADTSSKNNVQDLGWSLEDDLKEWNAAFDAFKQCQPCQTADLTSVVPGVGTMANQNGTRYQQSGNNEYHCSEGYSVNMCSRLQAKTKMYTASWRDMEVAGAQGSITPVQIRHEGRTFDLATLNPLTNNINHPYGASTIRKTTDPLLAWLAYLFLTVSAIGFLAVYCRFRYVRKRQQQAAAARANMLVPLVRNNTRKTFMTVEA